MQLLKNTGYLFAARVINALCIMGIVLIISRTLGPDIFGGYAFLSAVIMTGVVMASFGLDTLMVREVSRDTSQGNRFLSTVVGFKIISSFVVIAFIIGLFSLFLRGQAMIRLLCVFSIVICLNSLSQTFWYYGDAFQKFQFHAGLWAFSNMAKVGTVWLFVSFRQDLDTVVYALLLAEVISLIAAISLVRSRFRLVLVGGFSLKSVTAAFKRAWPLAVVFILSAVYFRVDLMILEILMDEKAVGMYAAAYKPLEFLSIIPTTVAVAALPALAGDYSTNMKEFRSSFYKTVTVLGIGGGVVGFVLYLFSRQIILLLYGPAFSASVLSLSILSGAVFFLFVNGYLIYVAIATNNDRPVALILVLSTTLNIMLNFYLIPRYSHAGAAISKLLSEILMSLFLVFVFVREDILVRKSVSMVQFSDA
jgi:O-antigen/teichoic acid export membrane protein